MLDLKQSINQSINHCLWHSSLLKIEEVWENMKLNESGKVETKVGRTRNPVIPSAQHVQLCVRICMIFKWFAHVPYCIKFSGVPLCYGN